MRPGERTTPGFVIALAVAGVLFFLIPLAGLVARAPWRDVPELLTSDLVVDAIRLSLVASLGATVLSIVFGIPIAFVLARSQFPGRSLLRGLVLLPLVLPPVVTGTALLLALGRRGVIGEPLSEATGLVLPFSIWGVIIAATLVSMPFLVITVEGALNNLDPKYEAAASSLGAGRWRVMNRVTLRLIGPSLAAGLLLTWARALGEFGATITFAGNLAGRTQTLPLAVFVGLEQDRDTAIAISLVMVGISLLVLVLLRDRWWRAR